MENLPGLEVEEYETLEQAHANTLQEDPAIQAHTLDHILWVEEPEDHRYS